MTTGTHPDHGAWSDSSTQPVLQLMVEAVAEMSGFEQVDLSIAREGRLVPVAHAGPARLAPLDEALPADDGPDCRLRFVGAESTDDEWRSGDLLLGVLTEGGRVVGVLRIDRPTSGRRPDPAQWRLLERCAAQAERAVVAAFEQEELREQVGHAESARRMVRSALVPAHTSLEDVLEHTHWPLVEGFRATGSWIEVTDPAAVGRGYARARNSAVIVLPDELVDLGHELARRLWAAQQTLVVDTGSAPEVEDLDLRRVHDQLTELGLASVLVVPMGAGQQCFGFLALGRRPVDPPWSSVEKGSALQIGHDLGAALRTASALERERALVRELQQLDDYRSRLIATLSHELRTPLTVISGNLEMLGALDIGEEGARHHRAMTRGTSRMQKVVDDLLLLARVSDPQHPLERTPVDLREIVEEVAALVRITMQSKQLDLDVSLPDTALEVLGSPSELDRLVGNLVSNAAKYTDPGGRVSVTAARDAHRVVLTVADTGIGISEEDREGLFRAFYRTSNPDALRQPGTGLGLAIVATIAERHGGDVAVTSELGRGTTFTVALPVSSG